MPARPLEPTAGRTGPELADTSAWVASRRVPDLRAAFDERLVAGRVATCDQVALELLFSARDRVEFVARRTQLGELPRCPIGEREWMRAFDVFEELAGLGPLHHRQVKPADLLIAAAAESAGVGVLHYDRDFEVIAGVTGQPQRWIAPAGAAG